MPSFDSTRPTRPDPTLAPAPDDRESPAEPQLARLSSLLRAATEAGALLAQINDEPDVYEAVCRFAVTDIHCDLAWIGLTEPGTRAIRVQTAFGEPREFLADAGIAVGSTIQSHLSIRAALASRESAVVPDLAASSDECAPAGGRHGLRSMAVVPLHAGKLVIGILVCYSARNAAFGADEIAILEALVGEAMTRLAAIDKDRHRREAQKALAKTEERYRLLFEAAPLGVMVIGPEGVEVNDSLLAMFGYRDRDQFAGGDLEDLVPADCRDDIAVFRDSLVGQDRTPAIIRTRGLRADGTSFPLLVDGTQVAVGEGDNAVYFLTDLGPMETAESLARTARSQYRHLVEAAPLPVVSMTVDGIVQSWNPAAERLLGWTAAETLGRLLPGGLSDRDRRYLKAVVDGDARGAAAHETRVRARDGRMLDLRIRASQILDTGGSLAGLLLIAEDVTTERRLTMERARLATAIEQTAESIVITDLKGNITYVNPAFEATTGYGRDEVLGRNPRILKSGEQSPAFYDHMWAVLTSGQTWSGEFINRRKEGSSFVEEATISPIRGESGAVSGYVAVKRDITVLRAQQAALAATERSYKSLFDNMQEGHAHQRMIWENGVPVDYEFLSANQVFGELTGLGDVVGKRVSEVLPGLRESDPQLFEMYGRVAAGGPPEKLRTHVAALDMWFSISAYCPEPGTFAVVFENVTEQEKAEAAVRASEEKFATAFRSAPVLVAIVDVDTGELVDANDQALAVQGQTREEAIGRTLHDLGWLPAADFATGLEMMRKVDRFEAEENIRAAGDGRRLSLLTYGERIAIGGRNCFLVSAVDITARKQAETALEEHKRLLQDVIDAAADSIYAKGLDGNYLLVNRQVADEAGKPIEAIVGHDDTAIFPPEAAAQIKAADDELLRTGETVTLEEHVVDRRGEDRWFSTTKGPLLGAGGERIGLVGVSRDITERKAQERIADARARLLAQSLHSSLEEMLQAMLAEAEEFTSSQIGFYHFVDDDEQALTLTEWSSRTKSTYCGVQGAGSHYPIEAAGVWVDCVRKRGPVIHNDYASLPHRKGLPDGHAPIVRELVVPVFRGDRIRAVVGVGNKATDYGDRDVDAVVRLADVAFDIAERMRVESRMRRSEQIYRTVLESAPFAIGAHRNGRGLFANEAHRKMFGYSDPNRLLEMTPEDVLAPESLPSAFEMLRRRAAGDNPEPEYEVMGRRQDGSTFPMLVRYADVELPDGPATILFHLDLTEIRQAQEAVRQSEEKFSRAFRHSPVVVYITDLETEQLVDVNDEGLRLSGFGLDELVGKRAADLGWVSPEDQAALMAEVREKGRIIGKEVRRRAKDGHVVEALVYVERISIGGRDCMLTSSIDITERNQLARNLAEARALQQAVADSTPDWIFAVDAKNLGLTSFNRAFADQAAKVFGLKLEPGMPPNAMDSDPRRRNVWIEFFRRALDEGSFEVEYGAEFDTTLSLTFNQVVRDGEVIGISVFGRNITKARRAENELRVSEARFRAVSESSLSGIAIVDRGRLAYVNRAYATIFGYQPEELIGQEVMQLIAPVSQAQAAHAIRAAGDAADSNTALELTGLRKDGTTNVVLVMSADVEFDGRKVGISNVLDITERKRLEDDLRQSQKLEALGRLAGGVAHDFNNLLTAIGGYARLLKEDIALGGADPEYPVRIIEAADRASAMTSRLLAFSGRQTKRRVPVGLADSVKGLLPILKRVVPERIEIATDLAPVPSVLADSTEVDQILLNLVVNASDAISAAGTIRIETGLVEHDEEFVRLNKGAAAGPHVRLTVTDTGSGMDEATLARMYEPFFTTKPKGSGTGLGLAMVYGIVEGMDGSIDVASAPGAGTTFRIDLPVSGEVWDVKRDGGAPPASGNERILLVEDEPNVLVLSARILQRLGYRVTAVGSPREALERPATDFDLVVTDVVMPAMDGPEMVRNLRETNPTIPVLYVSGYQPKEEMTAALREPWTSLLPKPFTVAGIAQAIRGALEDSNAPHGAKDR